MAINKLSFTSTLSDLPNRPNASNGISASDMKILMDQNPEALRVFVNSLIDIIESTADGNSGADNIYATTISGLTGSTVQSLLESLKIYADTIAGTDPQILGDTINSCTEKNTPVDTDMMGLMDSASGNILKKLSWSSIKSTLKSYFDGLYTLANLGGVPSTTTVNGYALSSNVVVTKNDLSIENVTNNAQVKKIGSSTDNAIVRWDGTDGDTPNNSLVTIDDNGSINIPNTQSYKINGSALNTSNIADYIDKRYVTDAQSIVIGNTSGTNSGNETASSIGTLISGTSVKSNIIDADVFNIVDTEDSNILKKFTWSSIKSTLKSYFDGLYISGITWTSIFTTTKQFEGICYGNGLFVAITTDASNQIFTSSDGNNWTIQTCESGTLYDVCYGKSLFVAVGINKILTSPDGITWTARTCPTGTYLSVCFENNLFISVGLSGVIMTSPDGITWTARTGPDTYYNNHSVTYGAGLYVIGRGNSSLNNAILTSPDGITWTERTLTSTTNYWYNIKFHNGIFVAVGNNDSDRIMTSPDGITWTTRTSNSSSTLYGLTFAEGLFIATGYNKILTSPDGITWTARTPVAFARYWYNLVYGNGLIIAVGAVSTSTTNIMKSGKLGGNDTIDSKYLNGKTSYEYSLISNSIDEGTV